MNDEIANLSPATVDRTVINYIYGAQNVFAGAGQNITQIESIVIKERDLDGLKHAMSTLGVSDSDVGELISAIEGDSAAGSQTLGEHTKAWLKALPGKLTSGAVNVGVDVAKAAAKQWLFQYFRIDV